MYGYVTTVAKVLLPTPNQNASATLNFVFPVLRNVQVLNLSKAPYVIAGFTVSTKPGLRPVHKPVRPDSCIISDAVSNNVGAVLVGVDKGGR